MDSRIQRFLWTKRQKSARASRLPYVVSFESPLRYLEPIPLFLSYLLCVNCY